MKKQNETIENVKVNESASTAKVENESNEQNESKQESANTESNESKPQTTAPTSEQIAAAKVEQKHMTEIANRYTLDVPKEVERTKFAGAHVLGVWRVDKTKHTKKDGDKNSENKSSQVLKEFQIYAMKEFGNTIVAKRFGSDNIVKEFKKIGFKVRCREFENYEYDEYSTHFVVEKI